MPLTPKKGLAVLMFGICCFLILTTPVHADNNPALDLIKVLKKAGIPVAEIAARVSKTFNKTKSQIAKLLKQAGYNATQIARALKRALQATPSQVAKALKAARYSAAHIARTLKTVFRASPEIIAMALKMAPYTIMEITRALKSGIQATPGQIAKALKRARYSIGQIAGALKEALRLSRPLVAIALKVARFGAVEVGRVIKDKFRATKLQVQQALRTAGYAAQQIAMAIRTLFKIGTMELQQPMPVAAQQSIRLPWANWCESAWQASRFAINRVWISQAYFADIKINGPNAVGRPGCLKGPSLKTFIKSRMIAKRVPARIAGLFAEGIAGAWRSWQSGITIPGLPWYPSFAAFPGPQAPPTPNIPTPLSAAVSINLSSLADPGKLTKTILKNLGAEGRSTTAKLAIRNFASRFSTYFLVWVSKVQIVHVLGTGLVPTFSPPSYPLARW